MGAGLGVGRLSGLVHPKCTERHFGAAALLTAQSELPLQLTASLQSAQNVECLQWWSCSFSTVLGWALGLEEACAWTHCSVSAVKGGPLLRSFSRACFYSDEETQPSALVYLAELDSVTSTAEPGGLGGNAQRCIVRKRRIWSLPQCSAAAQRMNELWLCGHVATC